MQIKNLKLNKTNILATTPWILTITLVLSAPGIAIIRNRTHKVSEKDPFYFYGFNDASAQEYLDFKFEDGQEYFIGKDVLADAIQGNSSNVGLKIDEDGNTVAVKWNKIDSSVDKVLKYCHKYTDSKTGKTKIELSTPAEVTVIDGYRLIDKNNVTYDIKKSDIVKAQNERTISDNYLYLEANKNGKADKVEYIRKK